MSKSYMCDLCGDCINAEQDAMSTRELVNRNGNISPDGQAVVYQSSLILKVGVPNVCNRCWNLVREDLKDFISNHL